MWDNVPEDDQHVRVHLQLPQEGDLPGEILVLAPFSENLSADHQQYILRSTLYKLRHLRRGVQRLQLQPGDPHLRAGQHHLPGGPPGGRQRRWGEEDHAGLA